MKRTRVVLAAVLGLALAGVGFVAGRGCAGPSAGGEPMARADGEADEPQIWTCSMHPQIQQPEPGQCPICSMDLIPLEDDAGGGVGARELHLSEAARELADIQVTEVRRRRVAKGLRLVGKVAYDETRLATISAWVPGRLEQLYVDYTGIAVREGDHMVRIYSPEVLTAEEELLQAARALERVPADGAAGRRQQASELLAAAREKLRLWGLSNEQVAAIEETGIAGDTLTINAPKAGIVVDKYVDEGDYVKTGTPIYRIADLGRVWVELEAYEQDLPWLHYGQQVSFTSPAYPGETFTGRIAFVDPILSERTRTVDVRVNVDNERGRLKPGMLVHGTVETVLDAAGRVVTPDLAGKWISPMHPEVIKDEAGTCDVCGMALVPAADLGYAGADDAPAREPLTVPVSAVLLTGRRAVVYVRGTEPGVYEGREIEIGPRSEHLYVVTQGLAAGEKVVSHGAFKIDSALQIQAKPSMMSPAADEAADAGAADARATERFAAPSAFRAQVEAVLEAYFGVSEALGQDRADDAREHAAMAVPLMPFWGN